MNCGGYHRIHLLLVALVMISGCAASKEAPSCPFDGEADYARSAGCLVPVHGKILVVESTYGGITPPGGKTSKGESAQCAAHRETWEETGLDLMPGELVHVFDTGFHLYYCSIHARSGVVELGPLREVKGWYWLSVDDFDKAQWRYSGQGKILRDLLSGKE